MAIAQGWKSSLLPRLILYRLVNAMLVQTYFNPDEYWQGPEVAHRLVFGYGYLSWEWRERIRGGLHPLVFAGPYYLLKITHMDTPLLVAYAPRIIQAVLAAVMDLFVYRLAERRFSAGVARWTLFCQIISWFTFYCCVRPFSNTLEAVLSVIAFYYWPLDSARSAPHLWKLTPRQAALMFAALACMIRPTCAVVWFFLGCRELLRTRDPLLFMRRDVLPIGLLALGFSCLCDRLFFGEWVFVPWNFVHFNVIKGGGSYYGIHPFHWYFTQGYPVVTLTLLPIIALGVWRCRDRSLFYPVVWTNFVYSFIAHKEFRFLLPILPPSFVFAGAYLHSLQIDASRRATKTNRIPLLHLVVGFLLLSNISVAAYTSLVHQRGAVDVMGHLRQVAQDHPDMTVHFLMPCHSTPFYSLVHQNISMRILDCTPRDEPGYIDESDQFMESPAAFVETFYKPSGLHTLPTHIVTYDSLAVHLNAFFQRHHYFEDHSFFHSFVPIQRAKTSEWASRIVLHTRQFS